MKLVGKPSSMDPVWNLTGPHSNPRTVDMFQGQNQTPSKPKPQYEFWNRYFRAHDARAIAEIDFRVRYNPSSLRDRLTLQVVNERMALSKKPFTLGEALVEVQQKITQMKTAVPLTLIKGDKFFKGKPSPSAKYPQLVV